MNHLNKNINYYTFIFLRKVARIFRKFNLTQSDLNVAYASDSPRSDINNLLSWYLPVNHKLSIIDLTYNTNLSTYDLILYDYSIIKFSLSFLQHIHKIAPINPSYFNITEISNWSSLYPLCLPQKQIKTYQDTFKINVNEIAESLNKDSSCWLFGTGPSIESYKDLKIEETDTKIICNSIIKNKEFCSKIKPQIIACADPVFHFGHSEYAKQFRTDLVSYIKKSGIKVIMPNHHAILFIAHYPELINSIIGIKLTNQWNFNLLTKLSVKRTDNIFTLLMLPLAATFSKRIHLLGFDGKSLEINNYFWEHHSKFQYAELLEDAKNEHPSFFADRNYLKYSKLHEMLVAKIFKKMELRGIKVVSHARSFISSINAKY